MIDHTMNLNKTNNDGSPLSGGITKNTIDFEHDFSGRCNTAFSLTLLKLIPEDKFSETNAYHL